MYDNRSPMIQRISPIKSAMPIWIMDFATWVILVAMWYLFTGCGSSGNLLPVYDMYSDMTTDMLVCSIPVPCDQSDRMACNGVPSICACRSMACFCVQPNPPCPRKCFDKSSCLPGEVCTDNACAAP